MVGDARSGQARCQGRAVCDMLHGMHDPWLARYGQRRRVSHRRRALLLVALALARWPRSRLALGGRPLPDEEFARAR